MGWFTTKQSYAISVRFRARCIELELLLNDKAVPFPLVPEQLDQIAKADFKLSQALTAVLEFMKQIERPESGASFSSDDLIHFEKDDLQEPGVSIVDGKLTLAYTTIAAVRFWGLESVSGVSPGHLEQLKIPIYRKLRTRLTTEQNFGSPNFGFRLQVSDEYGSPVSLTRSTGHYYRLSDGSYAFLTPALHRLVTRIEQHDNLRKTDKYRASFDLQRREFSEIRTIAASAKSQMDRFSSDLNVVILERLPYEFQRSANGDLLISPVMPLGLESKDIELQEQLHGSDLEELPAYLKFRPRSSGTERPIVVLSQEAWSDYKKIKSLNSSGQAKLEDVLQKPDRYFDQPPRARTNLGETFSDRVVGFVFGKVTTNKADAGSGAGWGTGFDEQSTIIRSTAGATIPVQYRPTSELYALLKGAYLDLADTIREKEAELEIDQDLIFTPLPPELERTIEIPALGASFGLTELHHCCKRIELENVVELAPEEYPAAEECIANAMQAGKLVLEWKEQGAEDPVQIPLESLRRSIRREGASKNTDGVSPAISDYVSELGAPPHWHWRPTEHGRFRTAPNFRDSSQLLDHQAEGFAWLRWIFEHMSLGFDHEQKRGAMLADDMGLGKTIQVLSLITHIKSLPGVGRKPILIVAPVSLINDSWLKDGFRQFVQDEWVDRHVTLFSECPIRLDQNELLVEARRVNEEMLASGKALSECEISDGLKSRLTEFEQWARDRVILTSYEKLRMSSIMLASVPFSAVILDEAQKIKNVGVLQANAAKALQGDMCIAMTGTPIENSLMDLWGIMDFVLPGKLGTTKEFHAEFTEPVREAPPGTGARKELRRKLEAKLSPIWLRRTKAEVFRGAKGLPPITHHDSVLDKDRNQINAHAVVMSHAQRTVYDEYMGIFIHSTGGHKLATIRSLLEVCSAPWLAAELRVSWESHRRLFELCPKLEKTVQILESIRSGSDESGRKVIIFANVIQIQNSLAYFIADWNRKTSEKVIDVEVYNGESSPKARSEILARFRNGDGFRVLIISPRAGGAGLNITEANHVIHYTREWNPALEKQATDRVYRMGQKRSVHVYYPTTVTGDPEKPSAEEHLANILRSKREVMDDFTVSLDETSIGEDELLGSFGSDGNQNVRILGNKLSAMSPELFERLIAAIYKKRGMQIHWVGGSGDRGADVVCLSSNENILVQAKHSSTGAIQHSAGLNEVRGAKSVYEARYKAQFKLLAVTNSVFSEEASLFAYQEGDRVELLNGSDLARILEAEEITLQDLLAIKRNQA